EIAVYNRALSASEVNKHYNDGLNKIGYNGKIIEFLAENGRTDNTKFKFDIFVRNVALKDTSGFRDYLGDCLLSFSRNAAALGTDVSISATGPNFGSSSYDFSAQVNTKGNIELLIDFKNTGSGIPLPLSVKEFLCTVELTLLDSAANTNINWIPENLIIATGDFLRIPAYLNDLESVPLSAGFVSGEALTFQLEQNYPNPFNPSTTIRFAVPQAGKVTLNVYNVLGEKIRDLISGFYETGIHSVNFDGKDLNSGVYIYKLQSENFVKVKKMLLMK
ncbi:MAG: T9SS type A sorting domain-containing protein, partial [Ignavibacteria bacterium]